MTFSGGGTPRQLAARAFFNDLSNVNPTFDRYANKAIDFDFKLRPDSSFSQDDLDRFNKRQSESRQQFATRYGKDALKDVRTYDRVEDIPRYTQQELEQQKIERLKANPKSFYNRQNTPLNPRFDRPNQKVPQAVVDSYNSLIGKFRNLRDTGDQSAVGRQDFENVLNSLRDSPAEYIQPGEKYLGPAFENVDGSLLRDDPSSIFFTEKVKEKQAAAPFVSETRETGRAREIGMPMAPRTPAFAEVESPVVESQDPRLNREARRALRRERVAERREERKSGRADRVKARKAARMARRFKRMQNR